jgi:purine nucleosidase
LEWPEAGAVRLIGEYLGRFGTDGVPGAGFDLWISPLVYRIANKIVVDCRCRYSHTADGEVMAKKVIIDCDMGTDDAVALCMSLFDTEMEIVALTATEGCVTADQANNNIQAILGELDPDRYPRLGMASPADKAPPINTSYLYGSDGLGNAGFEVSQLQHLSPSDKLIIDCVRAHRDDITIVCLGPLTNLARAIQRDPALPGMINRVVMTGGSISVTGNITPAAEFNFYFDPESARRVFHSTLTKTLIPLDVTREVRFGFDFMDELPGDNTRTGCFLRQVLPFAYRSYRQQLGHEEIYLNDAVGMLAVIEPRLFQFEMMCGDVETEGELTRGATIFDRRTPREWQPNLEVAVSVNIDAARQQILDQLTMAGNLTS